MLKKGLFLLFFLALSVSLIYANTPFQGSLKNKPMTPEKFAGANDVFTGEAIFPPTNTPPCTDDIIGETWILGNTWYDIQHNCSCGRQIQIDSAGYVHVAWMRGEEAQAINRHIFYQLVDPAGALVFEPPLYPQMGVQVDLMNRAGFTTLAVHSDCRAVPCFHEGAGGDYNFHTAVGYDLFPYMGIFNVSEPPYLYYPNSDDMAILWPKIIRDRNDRYHILATESPPGDDPIIPSGQYYIGAELDLLMYQVIYTPEEFEHIADTEVLAMVAAASPVSNRVAIAWLEPWATDLSDTNQYDNDLILTISQDGLTWDWSDTINITNFLPPNLELLPDLFATVIDTMLADQDTIRCYDDICLYFDSNDLLHVAFATRAYYSIEGTISWGNGHIYHWDESNQQLSVLVNGWYGNGFYAPGAWNVYTQRASLAEDPATGDLYCMYQRYFTPMDTVLPYHPDFYLWGDTCDFSEGGYPNGEIWMTVSTDDGLTWAEGTNITNTYTPNAPAGECLSELTPSMAPDITDGYAHIFYILDRDAGTPLQDEGTWTDNEVIYHRVPISEIPATPTLGDFPPIHIDLNRYAPTITDYSPTFNTVYATPGDIYGFSITAEDPGAPIVYEWILEKVDSTSYVNVLERTVIGNESELTWTAPAEEGYYYIIGRAHGLSYFNERQWAIESSVGVHNTPVAVVPGEYGLSRNYPNPFNPQTRITMALPKAGNVSLIVYDVTGREVARLIDGWLEAGYKDVVFDGAQLSSGVYFARLNAGSFQQTQKLLLIK